jgi:hypothetical protein
MSCRQLRVGSHSEGRVAADVGAVRCCLQKQAQVELRADLLQLDFGGPARLLSKITIHANLLPEHQKIRADEGRVVLGVKEEQALQFAKLAHLIVLTVMIPFIVAYGRAYGSTGHPWRYVR